MPRIFLLTLFLFAGVALAGPRAGSWRPVAGDLGLAAVAAVARGGDGLLYAASGGWVYRLTPEGRWRTVGPYAPALRWDEGQSIEAVGPFPQAWLDRESDKAFAAIEAMAANEADGDTLTEDAARLLLQAYIDEPDPARDSPYRVVAMAPASDGVWVVTGAGVLRAGSLGVRGPVGHVQEATAAVATTQALWVATPDRMVRIGADGMPQEHRIGQVEGLAADAQGLVFVADGTVWVWPEGGEPVRQGPPTGRPSNVAAHGAVRWAATALALYRWDGREWVLCPPTGIEPRRMVAGAHGLVILGENRLLFVDSQCQAMERQQPPWPGGMALMDVHAEGDDVWLATSTGLSELVDASVTAADAGRVAAFKRAVRRLPTLEEVSAAAVRYQRLDASARSFGWRPIMRGLLPDVRLMYEVSPFRIETYDALSDQLLTVEVNPIRPRWLAMAEWTVRFDLLGALFDVQRASSLGELDPGATADDDPAPDPDAEATPDTEDGLVTPEDVFVDDTLGDSDAEEVADAASSVAAALLAVERRQAERDRQKLLTEVARLYRERLRTMYRLWVQLEPDGTHLADVMRLRETDARLDALTGGGFTRYAPTTEP
ncbi:MAG: hypothetical protein H6702_08115 [Myxococcales bacterium]|nr:hypothetical protein [Myxococcales bacterium]